MPHQSINNVFMIILAINIARQKPHIKSEAGDGWKQQIKAIPQAQTKIQH